VGGTPTPFQKPDFSLFYRHANASAQEDGTVVFRRPAFGLEPFFLHKWRQNLDDKGDVLDGECEETHLDAGAFVRSDLADNNIRPVFTNPRDEAGGKVICCHWKRRVKEENADPLQRLEGVYSQKGGETTIEFPAFRLDFRDASNGSFASTKVLKIPLISASAIVGSETACRPWFRSFTA
jgi:hypothetical protein